jgi:hypothetical protein
MTMAGHAIVLVQDNLGDIMHWFSSSLVVVSMVVLLYCMNFVTMKSYAYILFIAITLLVPIFAVMFFKGSASPNRSKKYSLLLLLGVLLPVTVGASLIVTVYKDNGVAINLILQGCCGLAGLSIFMLLAWVVMDAFGRNKALVGFMTSMCCVTMFFPIGVVLPVVYNTENLLALSNAVGFVVIMCMVAVCTSSLGLNSTMHRMQGEKKAKACVFKLRKALRQKRVILDATIGRILYDEFFLHRDLRPNPVRAKSGKVQILSRNTQHTKPLAHTMYVPGRNQCRQF